MKYLVESLKEEEVVRQIEASGTNSSETTTEATNGEEKDDSQPPPSIEMLVECLAEIVSELSLQ